ncbi:MAG: hypothetical protein AB1564_15440 [Chloroflexota bacterium]
MSPQRKGTLTEEIIFDETNGVFLDEKAKWLIGWPGYRTANGKAGLGYIETQAEWAHMQGLMFRWLITGKFRIRNPFYIILLLIYSVYSSSPILLLFAGTEAREVFWGNIPIFGHHVIIGVLILLNLIIGFFCKDKSESITGD